MYYILIILKVMTSISERQAYIYGWVLREDPVDTEDILTPSDLNITLSSEGLFSMYKCCDYDKLEGKRFFDFIRGLFDRHSKCVIYKSISISDKYITDCILDKITVKYNKYENNIYTWLGVDALDLLSCMYYDNRTCYSNNMYYTFLNWANPNIENTSNLPTFKWCKTDKEAIAPYKSRFTDSGFDLSILRKLKEVNGVSYYDTCIKVKPPSGFYFDVVGRSSISKTGWMLANNIGIIDSSYRGSIIIALVPVNNNAVPLELPFRIAQLIPRKLYLLKSTEVESLDNNTTRGSNGFGSSGK